MYEADDDSFLQDDGSVLSRGSPAPASKAKPARHQPPAAGGNNYQYQPQSMYQIPVQDGTPPNTQPRRLRNKQSFLSNGNMLPPPGPGPMLRPAPSFYMDPNMQSQYVMMPPNQPYGMPQPISLPPPPVIIQSGPAPYRNPSPYRDNRSMLAEQIEELEKYQRGRPRGNANSADNSLLMATLVSEQDALYGTNMLENITPMDQEYITSLMQRGVPEHEALRMAFDRKPHAIKPPKSATRDVDSLADKKALEEAIQLSLTESSRRASQPDRPSYSSYAAPSSDRADEEALEKAIQLSLQESKNRSSDNRYQQNNYGSGYSGNATSSHLQSSAAYASEYGHSYGNSSADSHHSQSHSYHAPPQRPSSYRGGDDASVGSASYYAQEGDHGQYSSQRRPSDVPTFDRQYPYNLSHERPADVLNRPYHVPPPVPISHPPPVHDGYARAADHRDTHYEYDHTSTSGSAYHSSNEYERQQRSAREVEELRARAYGKLSAPAPAPALHHSPPESPRYETAHPYERPVSQRSYPSAAPYTERSDYPYEQPPPERGYPSAQPPYEGHYDDRSVSTGSRSSYSGDDRSVDRYPYPQRPPAVAAPPRASYSYQEVSPTYRPPTEQQYYEQPEYRAPGAAGRAMPPPQYDAAYYDYDGAGSPDGAQRSFQSSRQVSDLTNNELEYSGENTPRNESADPLVNSPRDYPRYSEQEYRSAGSPGLNPYKGSGVAHAQYSTGDQSRYAQQGLRSETQTTSYVTKTQSASHAQSANYNSDYNSDYTSDFNSKASAYPPSSPSMTAPRRTMQDPPVYQSRPLPVPASPSTAPAPMTFAKVQPIQQARGIAATSSHSDHLPEYADDSQPDMPQHQWRKTLTRLVSKLTVDDDEFESP